jgi:ABC-2 type transport system ATP-binding protein
MPKRFTDWRRRLAKQIEGLCAPPARRYTRGVAAATRSAVAVSALHVERGGREVLHGIDFSMPVGVVAGFIGPSGCGKSTLMRAIVGVQVVRSGEVSVFGLPAGSAPLRRRVGYSTQFPAVYQDLTVTENLQYFASVLGAPPSDVDRVVAEVSLQQHAHALASRLSGGQLTRASLAVALLGSPELLVLDEPTVGLDPVTREELWGLFHELRKDGRVTLLISSHVMDEAARCDTLLLMRDGRILMQTTPDILRAAAGTSNLDDAFLRVIRSAEQHPR